MFGRQHCDRWRRLDSLGRLITGVLSRSHKASEEYPPK
jgi:hypothetical protein